MSDLGTTGNGFDFQLNPFGFGGQRASVTSVPYPVVAEEVLDGRVEGAFNVKIAQNLEDFDTSSQALDGTIRDILIRVMMPMDSIDVTIAGMGGDMAAILKSFAMSDNFDSSMTGLSGDMRTILIVITMPTDAFDGVQAICTGGTLQ